jgi:hypothetical protein
MRRLLPLLALACAPEGEGEVTPDVACADEGNVEVTLEVATLGEDDLADPEWGGLAAAPSPDVRGTFQLTTGDRVRGDEPPADDVFDPVGTMRLHTTCRFRMEPRQAMLYAESDSVPHPGCIGGSEPQSGCFDTGWYGGVPVLVTEEGLLRVRIEVAPQCECYD